MLRHVILLTVFLTYMTCNVNCWDCSSEQLNACRQAIDREQNKHESTLVSKVSQLALCQETRENFNCLVWYATRCLALETDRQRLGGEIKGARDFLRQHCELEDGSDENWQDGSCYGSHEIARCNQHYRSRTRGSSNPPSIATPIDLQEECIKFNEYRDCIGEHVSRRCTRRDSNFLSSYLIDHASEVAFVCDVPDAPKGTQRLPFADRLTFGTSGGLPSIPNLGDALKSVSCLPEVQDEVKTCDADFAEAFQRTSANVMDAEKRNEALCCIYSTLENCVKHKVEAKCGAQSAKLVDTFLIKAKSQIKVDCSTVDMSSCQSAGNSRVQLSAIHSLLVTFISMFIMFLIHK